MKKSLVVYFSHNKENYFTGTIQYIEEGNTKIVAEKLKELVDGDIFEIQPLHDYPEKYEECTSVAKEELNSNSRPKIKNIVPHLEQYDTIYLGYPNWWSTMPMVVWTFLESYDFTNKDIYPFCTHEGSGMGKSEKDIKKITEKANVYTGLAIQGSSVKNCDEKLIEWIGK